jgi:MerR family transcriptional regulator, copper efflux regulator
MPTVAAHRPTLRDVLVPIDEVARRLGLKASAIRYYEERGLVTPVSRQAGRRWYGPAEIRQIAAVQYWQRSGLMTLEEISEVLGEPTSTEQWRQVVRARADALSQQVQRMQEARDFLEHVLKHHDSRPDGCPYYEALLAEQVEPGSANAVGHAVR